MENDAATVARHAYKSIFTDYVSGAHNRAFLDLVLAAKYDSDADLGVVVFDVQIPQYRRVADAVLRGVADSLRYVLPEVARYGDNKFVAFLPECNGQLVDWAEVARFAVALNPVFVDNQRIKPSVRVGSAKRRLFESIDSLVCRAEGTLNAKK